LLSVNALVLGDTAMGTTFEEVRIYCSRSVGYYAALIKR